jgi:hypothetical protein
MNNGMTRTEAILEARRMMGNGKFMRSVTGIRPLNVYFDEEDLACGHTVARSTLATPRKGVDCRECAEAWINANSPPATPQKAGGGK